MKKLKQALSLTLALALSLALAVPAFAAGTQEVPVFSPEEVETTFSVYPIGTATISYEDYDGSPATVTAYVFDQDVLVTTKDGRSFEMWSSDALNGMGDISEFDDGGSWFMQGWDWAVYQFALYSGEHSPDMITKACMDNLIAEGYQVEFHAAEPAQSQQPTEPAVPDAPGSYTVKKGDTWSSICINFYGNNAQRYSLMNANKGMKLTAGTVITLPEKLGKYVLIPAPSAAEGEKLYTVKRGDTLSKIAAAEYGKAREYKAIYERNADRLKNANTIYEGQVIVLPAKTVK